MTIRLKLLGGPILKVQADSRNRPNQGILALMQ